MPDAEPNQFIQHQVERNIKLVQQVGALVNDNKLQLVYSRDAVLSAQKKLKNEGFLVHRNFMVIHLAVSEKSGKYKQGPHKLLSYSVNSQLKSRNQVVDYVSNYYMEQSKPLPVADEIIESVLALLTIKK